MKFTASKDCSSLPVSAAKRFAIAGPSPLGRGLREVVFGLTALFAASVDANNHFVLFAWEIVEGEKSGGMTRVERSSWIHCQVVARGGARRKLVRLKYFPGE